VKIHDIILGEVPHHEDMHVVSTFSVANPRQV